jgi:hypothetical protein
MISSIPRLLPGLPSPGGQPGESDGRGTGEGPTGFGLWDVVRPGEWERRKLVNKNKGEWGQVATEVVFRAPDPTSSDTRFERGEWSTDDELHLAVTGPVFMFGKLNLDGHYAADQEMRVIGRTGVMFKLPSPVGGPIELRGGPMVKIKDALRSEKSEEADLLLEVQAKWPMLGTAGLEYIYAAQPAQTPLDKTRLNQDLAFVIPVNGGKIRLGAKHRLEGYQEQSGPWPGSTELYLGVEIGR